MNDQIEENSFLTEIIPARYRRKVYAWYGIIGSLLAAVTGAVIVVTQDVPLWLAAFTAFYNGLTLLFGQLAKANTSKQ